MDSKITRLIEQASVIVGALPYLQAYRDKTFLIKFGGSVSHGGWREAAVSSCWHWLGR